MSAPKVDVLAVMERMANCQYDGTMSGRYSEEEARAARAAVAKLIEAARRGKPVPSYSEHGDAIVFTGADAAALRAAIANIDGAA